MANIKQEHVAENLSSFLRETFVGPPDEGASLDRGSYYLSPRGGLLQVLEPISAAEASQPPVAGAPTIAAHCAHIDYYVRILHGFILGKDQPVDWPGSWSPAVVNEDEWKALKLTLREGYDLIQNTVTTLEEWGDDSISDSLCVVAHTAYHLGAVRQALRAVKP